MTTPTRYSSPGDAGQGPVSQAQRLAAAAELRAYRTDPDVVALRVQRIRGQVDRLMWAGIALGLCSRGLSPKVAAALNAELTTARHHSIDTEAQGRAA